MQPLSGKVRVECQKLRVFCDFCNFFCLIRPFFQERKNERKSPKNVKNCGFLAIFLCLKKKEKGFLRSRGGCCWGARWLCWLFLCFALVVWLDILPKVACHGDEVGDDSWLKWHSTFLTVLRHSWICRRHRIG